MSVRDIIQQNVQSVLARVAGAALRAGREPDSVRLVAVTKYAELEWVRVLRELGGIDLGENRPQQLLERAVRLGLTEGEIRWHLIGHLQRNKVRKILPVASLIHSIDSLRLLAEVDRLAEELETRPHVLLELNLIDDPNKQGFRRDELLEAWSEIARAQNVVVDGLMTMAAETDDSETARPTFAALRSLRDALRSRAPHWSLPQLSMGMTSDFEVAVEEGATLVRVGSALWRGLASQ